MCSDRNVIVVSNPFEIIEMLKDVNSSDIWVIGGASIYREFLPLVSRVYLTQVHTIFQRGITNTLNSHDMLNPTKVYFPINILDEQFERIESTEIEDIDIFTKRRYKTTFSEYIRILNKKKRRIEISFSFFTVNIIKITIYYLIE